MPDGSSGKNFLRISFGKTKPNLPPLLLATRLPIFMIINLLAFKATKLGRMKCQRTIKLTVLAAIPPFLE